MRADCLAYWRAYCAAFRQLLAPTRLVGFIWLALVAASLLLPLMLSSEQPYFSLVSLIAGTTLLPLLLLAPLQTAKTLNLAIWRLLPRAQLAFFMAWLSLMLLALALILWLPIGLSLTTCLLVFVAFITLSFSCFYVASPMPMAVACAALSLLPAPVGMAWRTSPVQALAQWLADSQLASLHALINQHSALLLLLVTPLLIGFFMYQWLAPRTKRPSNANHRQQYLSKLDVWLSKLPNKPLPVGDELLFANLYSLRKSYLSLPLLTLGLPLVLLAMMSFATGEVVLTLIVSLSLLMVLAWCMDSLLRLSHNLRKAWLFLPLGRDQLFAKLEQLAVRKLAIVWLFLIPSCLLSLPLQAALITLLLLPLVLYGWLLMLWLMLNVASLFSGLAALAFTGALVALYWQSPWLLVPAALPLIGLCLYLRPQVQQQFAEQDWARFKGKPSNDSWRGI